MNVRIVVADEREANFFDLSKPTDPLLPAGVLANAAAGMKDGELETDRPGRGSNTGAPGGPMAARHTLDGGERSTRRREMENFARDVARSLDEGRARNEFDRLVIVAGPRMLGRIRESLPDAARSLVCAEIPKNLLHGDAEVIRDAVPREAFLH